MCLKNADLLCVGKPNQNTITNGNTIQQKLTKTKTLNEAILVEKYTNSRPVYLRNP